MILELPINTNFVANVVGMVRLVNGDAYFTNSILKNKSNYFSFFYTLQASYYFEIMESKGGEIECNELESGKLIQAPDAGVSDRCALTSPVPELIPPSILREGVKLSSFMAFLFSAMMAIAGLVFINADQTYIMVDILDYSRDKVGSAAGNLVLADEFLSMAMVSVWGALSDKWGRRWIFSLGLSLMAVATALCPFAQSVFPSGPSYFFQSLLAFRLLFALGGSASTATLTALIGDYSRDSSRAKVAGITGFASGLGALFAALILSRLPTFFTGDSNLAPGGLRDLPNGGVTLVITFTITATLLLVAALVAAIFLRAPPELSTNISIPAKLCLPQRIRTGVTAMRDPLVLLAYVSGFVARADSIALTLFIAPWVDKYMTAHGLCPPPTPNTVSTRCQPAKRLASTLMSVAHTTILLGAPLFGVLSDKIGSIKAIAIPSGSGLLAFGILSFLKNPRSGLVYGAMAMAGLADIGMIIASMALMASVSAPQHRGALAGVYSFFGALGIIITSKVGGYLFDQVRETAAFSVVAIASGIAFIFSLALLTIFRGSVDINRQEL